MSHGTPSTPPEPDHGSLKECCPRHELTITVRRFSWLSWPTKTTTWEKDGSTESCEDVHRLADRLRALGAERVVVRHLDHRPTRAEKGYHVGRIKRCDTGCWRTGDCTGACATHART